MSQVCVECLVRSGERDISDVGMVRKKLHTVMLCSGTDWLGSGVLGELRMDSLIAARRCARCCALCFITPS
jgi:hypothetical protein